MSLPKKWKHEMYEEVNAQKHFMQKVVGLGLGPNIAIKFEGQASKSPKRWSCSGWNADLPKYPVNPKGIS